MLDLRDLIIERIDEAVMLRENITTRVTNLDHPASLDSELRVNRAILKSLSKAKKK